MSLPLAKEVNELEVYRGKIFVGKLVRTTMGCEIHFDQRFLEATKYHELSYTIRKDKQNHKRLGDNLPPFFAGLLPEGLRLKALVKKVKTSQDDLFSLLAAVSKNSIGDVFVVNTSSNQSTYKPVQLKETNFYELFQKSIHFENTTHEDENIAGVQEKMSASMISFPLNVAKKNKSYILKLNPKDKPKLVHIESLTLQLAKKCGLQVNATKLVKDKDENYGLLVQRFDRVTKDKSTEPTKIHQEDACQFLDRYPADKYRLSFKEICSGINKLSTAPLIEIQKAIQLYVFSYLVGNGDLHAKNISLQTIPDTNQIKLTPVYDLICTYIYGDKKMALKINGRDDNIKRKDIISFAKSFNIPEKSMTLNLHKLLANFKTHWEIPMGAMSERERAEYSKMVKKRLQDLC